MSQTPRQKYREEYRRIIESRRTLAFKAMGLLSALVAMNKDKIEGHTFDTIRDLVEKYDKATEEIQHIELLLDLIDHHESSDEGNI